MTLRGDRYLSHATLGVAAIPSVFTEGSTSRASGHWPTADRSVGLVAGCWEASGCRLLPEGALYSLEGAGRRTPDDAVFTRQCSGWRATSSRYVDGLHCGAPALLLGYENRRLSWLRKGAPHCEIEQVQLVEPPRCSAVSSKFNPRRVMTQRVRPCNALWTARSGRDFLSSRALVEEPILAHRGTTTDISAIVGILFVGAGG